MLLVCCLFFFFSLLATKHAHSLAGAWYLKDVQIVNMKVLVINVKHSLGFSLSYEIPGSWYKDQDISFARLFNFSSFMFSTCCFFLFFAAGDSS